MSDKSRTGGAGSSETRLRAARALCAKTYPYLAPALWKLRIMPAKERDGVSTAPTMGVDMYWRCYYNPEFVAGLLIQQLAAVLAHEVWHLLRDHSARGERHGVSNKGFVVRADLARIWNYAGDAEINDGLADLPEGAVTPQRLEMPENLLAEQYYQALLKKAKKIPMIIVVYGGSCADGIAREWEDAPQDADRLSPIEKELIRRAVAEGVKLAGNEACQQARAWADTVLTEKPLPWQQLLAAETRRAVAYVAGQGDYTWTRPSRRSAGRTWITPAIRRPVPLVTVLVDTSASMSADELAVARREVEGVLRAIAADVVVLSCDTQAASHGRRRTVRGMDLQGGGGTDMGVGLRLAEQVHPRPDVIITLTDGHTPWPESAPRARHITVLVGEGCAEQGAPFGRTVRAGACQQREEVKCV